jgi:hypothetical protein
MAKRRQAAQVRHDQSFKGRQFTSEVILWAELAKVPPAKQVECQRRESDGI